MSGTDARTHTRTLARAHACTCARTNAVRAASARAPLRSGRASDRRTRTRRADRLGQITVTVTASRTHIACRPLASDRAARVGHPTPSESGSRNACRRAASVARAANAAARTTRSRGRRRHRRFWPAGEPQTFPELLVLRISDARRARAGADAGRQAQTPRPSLGGGGLARRAVGPGCGLRESRRAPRA